MAKFILMNTTTEASGIFTMRHDSHHSDGSKEEFIEIFEKETGSRLTDEERAEIIVCSNSVELELQDEEEGIKEYFSLELV